MYFKLFSLQFKVPGKLVPQPELTLHLKVEIRDRWFRYFTVFEGELEQKFIEKIENGYLVDLDGLPLTQHLNSGAKIRLSMEHQLKELALTSSKDNEVWVLRVD